LEEMVAARLDPITHSFPPLEAPEVLVETTEEDFFRSPDSILLDQFQDQTAPILEFLGEVGWELGAGAGEEECRENRIQTTSDPQDGMETLFE